MTLEISQEKLKKVMTAASADDLALFQPALQQECNAAEINTSLRFAHFVAQVAHESNELRARVENLNYSAKGLRSVFGRYFTTDEMAAQCERKPESIANIVYANRLGNGATETGDGWKYRGRGLIQLTGRDNYRACGSAIGQDLVTNPDLISQNPSVSVAAAIWFWKKNGLSALADQDDINGITRRINGGLNGLADRKDYLAKAKRAFG
ncbi:glycoside hydrolase family 19 protein [Dickeya solani]|uniref:Glycoside hydrolase family 19 protein n=1 Tax=Dickeya solani TaxID=1089444 RepID=A0ABU4ELT2_9GAMM|nr:glycoside hydrolase family 19 protein [Dickeya solani]MCA7000643.1 glycoside hydrolase family 19 protein [Dickeya solani]MCZ0820283.1 glycoside hydrolase family 19 protein [Dickeya solani]MDV6997460.1 glycoside hydrolase family 19 protein [Dickeya solani]MDV7006015.1 glycoside hydrolase family 19 protein [Dickeya solani]MDV7040173.1 glycoside hydrolase family 19 protein [Dickeya solani]